VNYITPFKSSQVLIIAHQKHCCIILSARKHAHELHIYVVGEPSRGGNSSKADFDKLLRRLRQTLERNLPLIGSKN
jgi:hypothetical protein